MADLSTHYKERSPIQTVELVENFFKNNDLELKLSDVNQSEAGTWYCHVDAFKNGVLVGKSNGKGATKEYALASGYAELYERFCNQIEFINHPFFTKKMIELNKDRGYYFHPKEKKLTYEQWIGGIERAKEYFSIFGGGYPDLIRAMSEYITDGLYIGVPFQRLNKPDEVVYVDPRLIHRIERSNGMAAGNTLNEALVQGLSELVEREATGNLLETLTSDKSVYALKLENIDNPALQEMIKNIHEAGYDFYLFDLSYNYSLPVIMSLLLDRKNGVMNINFGSFPVFDIAAERVITELYQGIKSYHTKDFLSRLQLPYKNFSYSDIMKLYGNSIGGEVFSADFFDHIVYKDSYNTEVFINRNHSNEELVQYYSDLEEKIGFKFYYLDNSLCKDLTAVYIFTEHTEQHHSNNVCIQYKFEMTELDAQIAINELNDFMQILNNIYEDKPIDMARLIDIVRMNNWTPAVDSILENLFLWNGCFITHTPEWSSYYIIPLTYSYDQLDNHLFSMVNTEIFYPYKKYIQLREYVKSGKYSTEELLNIFNNIFSYNITEEDIIKCLSPAYLLSRAYIKPLQEFVHGDYRDVVAIYANNIPS